MGRSLLDLAMTGRPKLEILRYLVMEKKLSVLDTKDPSLAPRALDSLLRSGVSLPPSESITRSPMDAIPGQPLIHVIDDLTEHSDTVTLDDAVSEIVSRIAGRSNYCMRNLHCIIASASCVTRIPWTASSSRAVTRSAASTAANISTPAPSVKGIAQCFEYFVTETMTNASYTLEGRAHSHENEVIKELPTLVAFVLRMI